MSNKRKEIERWREELWSRYQEAPEPESEEIRRELLDPLTPAQQSGETENRAIQEMGREMGKL